jgi:hypothetical protein
MNLFYAPLAELSKAGLYVALAVLVGIGLWKRFVRKEDGWATWIHAAVFIHFLVGALYSGIRMLTTDEMEDMPIRRIFAVEAWLNFAWAAFYFLALQFLDGLKAIRTGTSR